MSSIVGQTAYGEWQMEVQDDRVGATNNATLVSWQLSFIFANTNIAFSSLGTLAGGLALTNTMVGNSLAYYVVNVPTAASYATNLLLFANANVNLWFSTNFPPTITNANDKKIIGPATSGSTTLSTNLAPVSPAIMAPPYIIPGQTYYLVVENTNNFNVTLGVEVDFDHGNSPSSALPLHFTRFKKSASSFQMQWPATAGATYQVQWSTNLTKAWTTIAYPNMTVINGTASFTDNGSQTAPLGPRRFYRLVQTSSGSGGSKQ